MATVALIPARGGSKRVEKKNLQYVGNHSLVGTAIRTAVESGIFDHIILTTDSKEIAMHATGHFNDLIIFNRPSELAEDNTPMFPVVRHAVEEYVKLKGAVPDDIVLLQPTSPLRTAADVRAAHQLYKERGCDALISVTEPEADLVFKLGLGGRLRAEPSCVVPNGAIYILWGGAVAAGKDWYDGLMYAYHMPKDRSIDVDTQRDLEEARKVWNLTYAAA